MYPSDKKEDDLNFKRVLQCFLALAMYPFGLKELSRHDFLSNAPFDRFSLAMYPSDQNFLKALFLRGTPAGSGPIRALFACQFRHFDEDDVISKAAKNRVQVGKQKSFKTNWKTRFWGVVLAAYVGFILAAKMSFCMFFVHERVP